MSEKSNDSGKSGSDSTPEEFTMSKEVVRNREVEIQMSLYDVKASEHPKPPAQDSTKKSKD